MWVYLSESSVFRSFNDEENSLVWHEEALELGNYNEPEKTKDLVYKPSQVSLVNDTLYVLFAGRDLRGRGMCRNVWISGCPEQWYSIRAHFLRTDRKLP
eukprot:3251667-Pyramimonas_sp.AAC.2